ncbi:MAG: hypothetical protein K2H60_02235 [Muribaculaceae bacterium]|nr:hypothetical protein [Muribaculaceae bacterium]
MKLRIILTFISLIVSLALRLPDARGAEGKRLLIINGYHDGAPWAQEIINPVLYDIAKRDDFVAPEVVYLSNTLIHNEQDFQTMENGLFERFSDRKPDYLVLVGNFTFTLRDRIVKEWGNVPMLLVCQSEEYGSQEFYYTYVEEDKACEELRPLQELQGKYNFSIVHIPNLYEQTINMMKEMFPGMNHLVFIADALYINRHLNHEIRDFMEEQYPDITYEWLVASDENGKLLQQYLNNRNFNTGILLSTWFFERMTIHGYPQLIAGDAHLIKSVRRPVFGLRYAYFSYGLTGGFFPSPEEFHEDLKAGLADLISDKDMSKVPFRTVQHAFPIVNYEKLERCKISPTVCPAGTVFLNRPKTLWEEHYIAIVAAGIVLMALIAVTAVLLLYQKRRIEMLAERDRLVGNMPIGYSRATLHRDAKGNVVEVDYHGWNEMFGKVLQRNEHLDHPSKLFEKGEISRFIDRLIRERRTMRFSHHFDVTDTDYEFLATIINEKGPDVDEIDIFAVDITDQKKKEVMLIEAREKAMESDKLKMAFLANMSHEIRTPLNAIVGFSTMLTKTADPKKQARFVDIINLNNELLLKLISDVLDTAKIESNTLDVYKEPTDVNKVMLTADSTVRLRLHKGVALNLVLGEPECEIYTDSDRLNQIMVNFLTNAIKFTQKGSITFGYEVRGNEIYFYVRDTGQGIAPENLGKLFTRFTKLNNFVQGTGLGLSISKSIVERLGGKIGASSDGEGKGSLFWFTLPYPK